MPTHDGSASVARTLSGKQRLHPLAIIFPLNSYSRPPLLGRSIRIPRWVGLSLLFVVGLIVDYYSADVSMLDDAGVLVQNDELTWGHLSILIIVLGTAATVPPRPVVVVPVVDRRRRHLDQRRYLQRVAAAGNVRPHRDNGPLVHAASASLRCLQDRARDDRCRPGITRCPIWLPVEQERKLPRGPTDHEARVRGRGQRGKTVRSAQRRSARVVGSDPCRSDDHSNSVAP